VEREPALSRGRSVSSGRRCLGGAALLLSALLAPAGATHADAARPDVLLITLDTTRADVLGAAGGAAATPHLDALAARGVRFASAWAAAPVTLPAHASLFSGRPPGEHGLRENGLGALEESIPLLAERFAAAGYRTGAVVASRILDRRFGLDRGFAHYDDRMPAERTGEFGYPERDAAAVVDAALAWLGEAGRGANRPPLLLWVHFYDPHAPYLDPAAPAGAPERRRYGGEVARVDRELGRLLAALPSPAGWLVAAVGDHGEAFGEQGEHGHGLLLQRATLEVPLLVAGPGVPAGRTFRRPVATANLARTLARLAGVPAGDLGGEPLGFDAEPPDEPVLHETWYPASVYGWSPLVGATLDGLRLVVGPGPRWYAPDGAGETEVAAGEPPERARQLARAVRGYREAHPFAARSPEVDERTRRELAALGYLSGATGKAGTIDPAQGVTWVGRFAAAGEREAAGDLAGAAAILRELVALSPQSIPFLSRAASLEARLGRRERAEALLRSALELQPDSEFVRLHLGQLLLEAGRVEAGEAELAAALERNPRFAPAWLALAEAARRRGDGALERRRLDEAIAAGTASAFLLARRAQIALGEGRAEAAEADAAAAIALLPEWEIGWFLGGEAAERLGRRELARQRYARAAESQAPLGAEARRRLAALAAPPQ
jgi:arylsulfatase A-like enzyme/tetratricopeptide (TPR) repeat protein